MTPFGSTFGTLRFDEKSFFNTFLDFAPYWEYKPTNGDAIDAILAIHADSPGVCTSEKNLNLSAIDKIHLNCDCIDGSVQKGVRQPILLNFILDKPSGYRVFCDSETIHYKKIKEIVLNTMTFYLEDDKNEQVNFNQETMTFTLQMIKI